MKLHRIVGVAVIVIVAIAASSALAASLFKISLTDLGMTQNSGNECKSPNIKSFWRDMDGFPNYDAELVTDYFGVFAAFSSNVYRGSQDEIFDLKPDVFGWIPHGKPFDLAGGFYAETFYKEEADRLTVMVVFRGTDGLTSIPDLISNASYVTQMLNPWDQYRTARSVFQEIRSEAAKAAKGRQLGFLAVGHSLGGGLARHMAAAFPCTAAIAFNSSFVDNNFRLEQNFSGQTVDLFEEFDPLSRSALYAGPDSFFKINPQHQWYRLYNVSMHDGQHGILIAAFAMALIPITCLEDRTKKCELSTETDADKYLRRPMPRDRSNVRNLYCIARPGSKEVKAEHCG